MPTRPRTPGATQAADPITAAAAEAAAKVLHKVAVKAPARAAPTTRPARAAKPAKAVKAGKPAKVRRKPVRDSFTMPEADFALIATLKARALSEQREVKKSELLRAGLHALAALATPALVAAIEQLEPVKIGRPKVS